MRRGQRVVLVDLVGRSDLNGRTGFVCKAADDPNGRIGVQLQPGEEQPVALRSQNLVLGAAVPELPSELWDAHLLPAGLTVVRSSANAPSARSGKAPSLLRRAFGGAYCSRWMRSRSRCRPRLPTGSCATRTRPAPTLACPWTRSCLSRPTRSTRFFPIPVRQRVRVPRPVTPVTRG